MGIMSSIRDILGRNRQLSEEFGVFDEERVIWHPSAVHSGDDVQIIYRGLLKDKGAKDLALHYGFDHWRGNARTVSMTKQPNGDFLASVKAEGDLEMNLCFVDSQGNWDNNQDLNWTINIEP